MINAKQKNCFCCLCWHSPTTIWNCRVLHLQVIIKVAVNMTKQPINICATYTDKTRFKFVKTWARNQIRFPCSRDSMSGEDHSNYSRSFCHELATWLSQGPSGSVQTPAAGVYMWVQGMTSCKALVILPDVKFDLWRITSWLNCCKKEI